MQACTTGNCETSTTKVPINTAYPDFPSARHDWIRPQDPPAPASADALHDAAEPTMEYKFTDHVVGAAGVLFTLAGYQDIAAIYPNLSVYYYWSARGKVVPR